MKDLLIYFEGIALKAATKKNALIGNTWTEDLKNRYYRKQIENTIADIEAKFPGTIHAVTAKDFLLKILCFNIMFILHKQF